MFWWRADYAEALLELGKVDEAAALVDAWEAEAQRLDRAAVLAEMTRCRGLVAAARGDVEDALAESLSKRSYNTRRSATRSGVRGHCSRSERSDGARDRNA